MANYSLRQLRYFMAVVEAGGLSAAARRLNISQSSVSEAVSALEQGFGSQLLVRSRAAGARLTPAGVRFHGRAAELLRRAREFEQAALAETDALTGQIDLACSAIIAPLFVPRLIAGFRRRNPQVRFNLVGGQPQGIAERLATGTVDTALLYDFDLPERVAKRLELARVRPHAIVARGHRLARAGKAALRDLARDPLILLDAPPSAAYFRRLFEARNLAPEVAFVSSSFELVRGLVGQGLGFSVLATRPAHDRTQDGETIAALELSDSVPPLNLIIAWPAQLDPSPPTAAFIAYCRTAFATPPHRKNR
ncbi:MAG: LysR family transcriptional regulator [Rhodospirillaceae bacterium]|nr:LysR family transcriptional regulator [Rhodospirillaceae bacterium]